MYTKDIVLYVFVYKLYVQGRSRSLTHIDNLDPAMLLRNEDMDSRSEPDTSHDQLLYVPPSAETRESRRKKLARSQVRERNKLDIE